MTDLGLNQKRAERRERRKEAPTVTLGPDTFKLPLKLPWEVVEAAAQDDEAGMVRALFGDQFDAFMAHAPDIDDVREILDNLRSLYGLTPGESQASGGPSRNGSGRSRRTSRSTTPQT